MRCRKLAALALLLGIRTFAAEAGAQSVDLVVGPRPIAFPGGVAVRGQELFVEGPAIDRLSRVDLASGAVTVVASEDDPDHEELVTPDDIWVDAATGDLYVVELLTGGVRRIAPDGTRTRILTGFSDGSFFVNGVALDAITGVRRPLEPLRLFVTTFSLDPNVETGIWEVDPEGIVSPRFVYGAAGNSLVIGEGLHGPDALAFDPAGKELYVSELFGGKVRAVDVDAQAARLVYDPGVAADFPIGGAFKFDAGGTIIYAEYHSGRILRLNPNGPPTQTPGVIATVEPGVHNVGIGNDGKIYLSNIVQGGITVIDPKRGNRRTELVERSLDIPTGMVTLQDGRLLVADQGSATLVDPARPKNKRISRPWVFLVDGLDLPVGAALVGSCDAYLSVTQRGTLQHVDLCLEANPGPATDVVPLHTFASPGDIVNGRTANELFVTDLAGFVFRVTLNGAEPATSTALQGLYANPTGIALGSDGLYVSESDGDRVRVVDPDSGETIRSIGDLDEPEGLAFDLDGSLLVVEAGRGRLTRVHADGKRETVLEGLATRIRGVFAIPFLNFYADVAVSPTGDIFVTSPEDGSLTRIVR